MAAGSKEGRSLKSQELARDHHAPRVTVTRCHNPIFTPEIFSSVGAQNETARTKPV
jgi:hypothetical protein